MKATDPQAQTVEDTFVLTIVSKDAPIVKTKIPDQELDADGDAMQIDMADVDTKEDGAQPAFETPDDSALTYTVSSKDASGETWPQTFKVTVNGAYVYRLVAADKTITRTMVLLK